MPYDQDQERIPAGEPGAGQWTSGGSRKIWNLALVFVALIFFGMAALGVPPPYEVSAVGAGLFFVTLAAVIALFR